MSVIRTLGSARAVLLFGLLYLVGQGVMLWFLPDLGGELLKLQVTTSWEHFQAMQAQWSDNQWAQYRAHFAPDFIFPWLYGGFLFVWLVRHTQAVSKPFRALWALPWLAAVADCIENAIHMMLLNAPQDPAFWVVVSGWLSRFKWATGLGLALTLIVLELRRLRSNRP